MQLPIVAPAPIVTAHADILRDLFAHRCQWRHLQHDGTGLSVLDNKSLANITRCVLERADTTTLSRFCSDAPWFHDRVKDRRVASLLQPPQAVRGLPADAVLRLDAPWCAQVGSVFDSGARHDHHGDATSRRAHQPVTRHDGSGPVRFPLALRWSRRYAERPQWAAFVHQHFPDRTSPTTQQERARFHKALAPGFLAEPALQHWPQQFRTTIAVGLARLAAAIQPKVPWRVLLFDRWYLAEALVSMARYDKKAWGSLLQQHRHLETNSVVLKDAAGQPIGLEGPPMAVEDLVPRIPPTAYRAVTVGATTSGTFTLAVRLPGLGKGRLVGRCTNAEWPGTDVVLVTHRVAWRAHRIIALSLQRWPIATCYQDGQGPLGWDAYRMRNAAAMQNHWCLVCVAYAFLHLDCLPSSPTPGSGPIKTIGEACRQQAQARMEGLILYAHKCLARGQRAADRFTSLFAKQSMVMAR